MQMQRSCGNASATRVIARSRSAQPGLGDHTETADATDSSLCPDAALDVDEPTNGQVSQPQAIPPIPPPADNAPKADRSAAATSPVERGAATGWSIQRDWKNTLGGIVDAGLGLVSGAANTVSHAAGSALTAVSGLAGDLADAAKGLVSAAVKELQSAYDAIAGQVGKVVETLKGGVESALDAAIKEATGFLSGIGAFFAGIGAAIVDLDAAKLRGAWTSVVGAAGMMLAGVKGVAGRVLGTIDGLWNNVKGMAAGLIGGVRGRAESLIAKIPGPFQGPARSVWNAIEARLNGLLSTIEATWKAIRKVASDKVDALVSKVTRAMASFTASTITPIIDTLSRVGSVIKLIERVADDPGLIITPMVEAITGMLKDLPDKSKTEAQTRITAGAAGGGPVAAAGPTRAGPAPAAAASAPVQRMIRRDAAKAGDPRSTLGVGELLSATWDALGEKVTKMWGNLGETVKDMVISMVYPPATWKALKQDWAEMTKELSTRVARFEHVRTDNFANFFEDIRRFVSNLVDFPLIVWRSFNAMAGRLSVYLGLALILGGAIGGAIAGGTGGAVLGGIFGVGAGAAPGGAAGVAAGAWAGAQAGYAAAESVGLALLLSFVGGEVANISKSIGDLLFVPQTKDEHSEDVNNVADSTIAIVAAGLLILVAFIGIAIAKRIWAIVKGIFSKFFPKAKPVVVEPPGAKPVEGDPASKPGDAPPGLKDRLIICRICDTVPGVPPDLMAQRAALSPEMRQFLDAKVERFFPDPAHPTPENFKALRGFMEGAAKKGGGDLEAGLRKLAPKAAPTGPPRGPAVGELPRLRSRIEGLIKEIEDFAAANPDRETVKAAADRLRQQLDGPVSDMENGRVEATPDQVQGVDRAIKGAQGEFDGAKTAPSGTKFNQIIDGVEIDQVRSDGTLAQRKSIRALRNPSRTFDDTVAQIKLTLKVAQNNPVNGLARKVVFEFPEGLSKEVGADLRAIDVNGQRATIVAPEIVVPPK